jgi:O-antigen/teichoic acid export membrane protein
MSTPLNMGKATLQQEAKKGVIWSIVEQGGAQAISFIVFVILARWLDPTSFGLIALANVFIVFLQVFVSQGFSSAIVQRADLKRGHLDTVLWVSIGIATVITIICIVGAPVFATFYGNAELTPIIRWLSPILIINAFSDVQSAILTKRLHFRSLAMRRLVSNLVGGCVGIVTVFAGYGVWALVGQQLTIALVGVVVLWTSSDWRPGFDISRTYYRDLFSFSINIVGSNLLNFVNRRSDDLLVGYYLGPEALGVYVVAYKIMRTIIDLLTVTVSKVAFPVFARVQAYPNKVRHGFYKAIHYVSLVAIPAFIAIVVLAPQIMEVAFGNQWMEAVPIVQILACAGIVHSLSAMTTSPLLALGKSGWRLGLTLFNAVSSVVAYVLVLGVFHADLRDMAIVYTVRAYLYFPSELFVLRHLINIEFFDYFRQIRLQIAASILMAIVLSITTLFISQLGNLYIQTAFLTLIGASVYGGIIALGNRGLLMELKMLLFSRR